ncbi:MAG: hypothetical protein M3R62_00975, partial [Acidobacteriota bacterium]|nr:hypothetical protein [Acidobacteriota bacterium]
MTAEGLEESRPAPGGSGRTRRALFVISAGFLLAAAVTRFSQLGDRPLHHDESIHAFQSYTLARDGSWRYDP